MDWKLFAISIGLVLVGYLFGRLMAQSTIIERDEEINWLRNDNRFLNAKLTQLTDRDAKGRFTGGKEDA